MTRRIIITLHAESALPKADWVIMEENGPVSEAVSAGELSELSTKTNDSDILVIVPAEDVLLLETVLPKLSKSKLRQALPYALEEQVVGDVDDLHFAIAEQTNDGTVPVAIVAKQKMRLWLETLNSAGIHPSAIIPMTLLLPWHENKWDIYSFDDTYLVRTGKYAGFAADKTSFDTILQLKHAEHPEILISSSSTSINDNNVIFTDTQNTINLLQGTYQAKRKITHTKNVWHYALYLAIAWIGISFFSHIVSFIILHHQASNIENEINQIYYRYFPHATSVVAPRDRMEQKLKEITNAAQKNNFLSLLATVGQSLMKTKGIRLQNLDYHNGILTLDISSAAFDNIDELSNHLSSSGLNVKQQNSATTGTQVKATLIINAGAT